MGETTQNTEWEWLSVYINSGYSFNLFCCFFFFFFFCGLTMGACETLVLHSGIEPELPTVEAQSLGHWTARKVPSLNFLRAHLVLNSRDIRTI